VLKTELIYSLSIKTYVGKLSITLSKMVVSNKPSISLDVLYTNSQSRRRRKEKIKKKMFIIHHRGGRKIHFSRNNQMFSVLF
jgi:hypothetical protein